MKTEYYVVLSIYGRKAVKRACDFQGGFCYRGIYDHGKRIAQLEVVVDEPGKYNGLEMAWVDVTTKPENVQKTLKQLARLGFKSCYAAIFDWIETDSDDIEVQKEYNCYIQI